MQQNHTARLQDLLTGALIGLVHVCANNGRDTDSDWMIIDGLAASQEEDPASDARLQQLLEEVDEIKYSLSPGCAVCASPCGNTDPYDMQKMWDAPEEIREAKLQILRGIRKMAADIRKAGKTEDPEQIEFLYRGLNAIGEDLDAEELLPVRNQMKAKWNT